MRVVQLSDIDLVSLSHQLKSGAVLLYPTETVAGIGCIGSNQASVKKVFAAKQRNPKKPVSYAFSSVEMVEKYVQVSDEVEPLFELFPGPVTLVLSRLESSPILHGTDGKTLGVRIPDRSWLLELIELTGEPIITTSANVSGLPTPTTVEELHKYPSIINNCDILVNWQGKLGGLPSTVINCVETPKIVRHGAIKEETIKHLLGT